MSKRRIQPPTFTTPATALQQFLQTAELSAVVPQLTPRALQRLVTVVGLDAAGDVLLHATSTQMRAVMDADLWSRTSAANAVSFSAERFGHWLQVLVESDVVAAARQLRALDRGLFTGAMARLVGVCSRETADRLGLLDTAPTWECGGLIVWARSEEPWDAVATLLAHLHLEHRDWLGTLLQAWRALSYEHLEEASGFDSLLDRRGQSLLDLDVARDERRDAQGYVTADVARSFLASARWPDTGDVGRDAEVRSYLRHITDASPAESDTPDPDQPIRTHGAADTHADADVAWLVGLIDACDGPVVVRGLLASAPTEPDMPASRVAALMANLASGGAASAAMLDVWQQELGFLANCLLESGVLPAQRSTEAEAVAAAIATCDLGLEQLEAQGGQVAPPTPVLAFRTGWSMLHRDVSMLAATELLRTLGQIARATTEFHDEVRALRRALQQALARKAPWEATTHLEVIAILDLPAWAVLTGLLSEYPVVPRGCLHEGTTRRLRHTTDLDFISSSRHLEWVGRFLGGLTRSLSSGA